MDIMNLVSQELILLVVAIYVLGEGLKRYNLYNDKYIPLGLLFFSVAFSLLLVGISAESILQGILCWGLAIGINQTFKQIKK